MQYPKVAHRLLKLQTNDLAEITEAISYPTVAKVGETGTYYNIQDSIQRDYRLVLDMGLEYVAQERGMVELF